MSVFHNLIVKEVKRETQNAVSVVFNIPENEKKYLDVIVKNSMIAGENKDVGILYIEKLKGGVVVFDTSIDQIGDLTDFNADKIIDGEGLDFANENDVENWAKNQFN